jgi:hypothetical protein
LFVACGSTSLNMVYRIPKSLKLFSKRPIAYKKESSLCLIYRET